MKSLSLLTFSLFLLLFGLRLFSIQSDSFDEVGYEETEQTTEPVSLFDMEPEKAKALLDDLDLYVQKNNVKNKKIIKREVAQKKPVKEVAPIVSKVLEEKYMELNEALIAQEDNMLDIKYMQDDIKRIKKDNKIEYKNSEAWSAEFILMLIIQEQFTLTEVNELKGPDDLGLEIQEWVKMKETAQTREFNKKIMAYKGVTEVEDNFEEISSLEEIESREFDSEQMEFFDDESRNSAISDFMERNLHSRNGENSDKQDLDPEEYMSETNFDYNSEEATRVPATLDNENEEENEEQVEYNNYNDGYKDEY